MRNNRYDRNWDNEYYSVNEEEEILKALAGSLSRAWTNVKKKWGEVVSDFSEDFKKSKNEEEAKRKTISTLNELKNSTITSIKNVNQIEEIQEILNGFEKTCNEIMSNFKTAKLSESMINENLWVGLKSLANVFKGYWEKFKKDYKAEYDKRILAYKEEQELHKKKQAELKQRKLDAVERRKLEKELEAEKKRLEKQSFKALSEAKDLAIDFIKKSIESTIKGIREYKTGSQAQLQKGQGQTQAQKGQVQKELGAQSTSEEKVKAKYKELLGEWKAKQKEDGKKNLSPGEGTRKRLKKQAEDLVGESKVIRTFESFVYKHY